MKNGYARNNMNFDSSGDGKGKPEKESSDADAFSHIVNRETGTIKEGRLIDCRRGIANLLRAV